MSLRKRSHIGFGLAAALLVFSCSDDSGPTELDCSAVSCPAAVTAHNVTLKDTSGAAVSLDSFSVTDGDTKEELTKKLDSTSYRIAQNTGTYPLYDDLSGSSGPVERRTLVFSGFIGQQAVITAQYDVFSDCCSSSITNGRLELVVSK